MIRSVVSNLILLFILLSLQTQLLAQPNVIEKRVKDWSINCTEQGAGQQQSCLLLQTIVLKETNSRLLQVAILKTPKGKQEKDKQTKEPTARITIPLGVFLPAGISLQIDKGEKTRYAILFCDQQGCHSTIRLDKKILTALKAGNQLTVTFSDLSRRSIGVPVSLLGFTAGLAAID